MVLLTSLNLLSGTQGKMFEKGCSRRMANGKKVHARRNQMIDNIMINGLYEDMKRKSEKKVRSRKRYQIIDNIMINGLYADACKKAEMRVEWRMLSLQ